ncbi:MAG: transcription-repair coupling factor [Nitratireductor sp.]
MLDKNLLSNFKNNDRTITLSSVPNGMLAFVFGELAKLESEPNEESDQKGLVYVAADGQKLGELINGLNFFAPNLEYIELPSWDCLPYDRVSPSNDVSAKRIDALSQIALRAKGSKPLLVLTTVNAWTQRCVPQDIMAKQSVHLTPGSQINMDNIIAWMMSNGFERTPAVRDRGEFAVRGGILDLHTPDSSDPIRLDFFGDTLETIRSFDISSQRTKGQLKSFSLIPMSEVVLDKSAITTFRQGYISNFGAATKEDALYQAISEGRRFAGTEHWLPLFYDKLDTLKDYCAGFKIITDQSAIESGKLRIEQVEDHYLSRKETLDSKIEGGTPYKPMAPDTLYLTIRELETSLDEAIQITPFSVPQTKARDVIDLGGQQSKSFSNERATGASVFSALIDYVVSERKRGQAVVIAAWTHGSSERMSTVLQEQGMDRIEQIATFAELENLPKGATAITALPLEEGFIANGVTIIAEQDVLGDRLVRRTKKRKASNFIAEAASLNEGDIVVHVEHGIARFMGLKTITAIGDPHDCLELHYSGDDKLFLPVENIELLSRYGSEDSTVQLDKLGGVAWQARKAKLKKNILEMADQLIKIAAERALRKAEAFLPPQGLLGEFNARFPYDETEDQLNAIEAVLDDLAAGTPMDRLICGDVGFGKTEVALRAAFVAAMAGKQVAVVVPTTLLSRQHFKTFQERFKGLPLNIQQASRLVGAKALNETKKGLSEGTVDIVVGTHALLAESIDFDRLGLLIIDEEQRFGVKHKERLKEIKSDVHVLTLSATPIPRTLQLALTGVRELSLITTAPVDRLAVRTFITPFDTMVVREALLREHYRGGQSFYVCPRVSDLEERKQFLQEHVPELKVVLAHGQMPPGELDDVMNAFYDGQYDVLLSTTIVESGLDIPTANTLIIHRADMFGLSQLYQLRGRVGRSKTRAYAIFTLPVHKVLTTGAERRLKVLQSIDTVGGGFGVASHDLDIRGSGNLLGDQQSGQIKEVGFELYQQMLEEAVAELKEGGEVEGTNERWSPQISVGAPVLIPESYVPDLQLRLGLYRRLADIASAREIDAFGAELIDRFGPLPEEVDYLLKIVFIKGLCVRAHIEKLDAGPKGLVIHFKDQEYANPAALLKWISEQGDLAKIRADQSLFLNRDWPTADKRLKGAAVIASKLVKFLSE